MSILEIMNNKDKTNFCKIVYEDDNFYIVPLSDSNKIWMIINNSIELKPMTKFKIKNNEVKVEKIKKENYSLIIKDDNKKIIIWDKCKIGISEKNELIFYDIKSDIDAYCIISFNYKSSHPLQLEVCKNKSYIFIHNRVMLLLETNSKYILNYNDVVTINNEKYKVTNFPLETPIEEKEEVKTILRVCKICGEKERNMVGPKCHHCFACESCAKLLPLCPLCSAEINDPIKIFYD